MIARRLTVSSGAAIAALILASLPVAASELSDYLEEAEGAVYSGRRVVVTVWAGVSRAAVLSIEHAGGMTLVNGGGRNAILGDGKAYEIGSAGGSIAFVAPGSMVGTSPYTTASGGRDVHLGRPTEIVDVMEGSLVRVRVVFDAETSAPLVTEVFNGDGDLYRYSSMVEFDPFMKKLPAPPRDDGEYHIMAPVEGALLPEQASRYQRVDAYRGPGGSEQGFYTDGLFTFSLFALEERSDVRRMTDGMPYWSNGFEYVLKIDPAEAWVLWATPDHTFVLVGDLPPDQLDAVLSALPRPGSRNWLKRMWHGLFG